MPFTEQDLKDQTGKNFVITGANTGLGFETARALAAKNAHVWLACRSEEKAQRAIAQIKQQVPGAKLDFIALDLGDLNQIGEAVEQIKMLGKLDCLINNAGLMTPPLGHTTQGFESQMGVNHLGHFALVGQLIDKIIADGTRVVVVASLAHKGGQIDWDDLHAANGYNAMKRYQASKLANLLFGMELERRLRTQNTEAKCVFSHPGVAATELMRHMPKALQVIATPAVSTIFNSPAQGAWPSLLAATEDVEGGSYWGPQGIFESRGKAGPAKIAGRALKKDDAERLWELSIKLTGITLNV
ncbi:SDR family NAD(P)-dependent oxidoreductase [Spongiibacter sp. KMU-158]|uniref:SDR family NAD(P)-dependent oxidoreductase n=1 Tax=Spongiibacter pelagi TaxID=2760804 RepID=A0A927C2G4_9GAMM|nr:oxidoreductase [Spongiibacter pelagi]MBD2859539.1 SDR family NAD(P)-dependent oxidoreductase [Spongiibacter pelagi]